MKWRISIVLYLLSISVAAQHSDSLKQRKNLVSIGGLSFIGITHIGLNQLWYADYPRSSFHFINDNKEWMQMDKLGHSYSAYYLGVLGIEAMEWAGYPRKKAIWLGGLYGTFFQTPIEVQDGFSTNWGASLGDLAANTFGTGLVIGQELLWDEQRIRLKYSYSPTQYAHTRPNTLGNGLTEEFLKDYNGQTYWFSANISSFLPNKTSIPKWLNLSLGYGANGMLGGEQNTWEDNLGNFYDYTSVPRYRQLYLAPDIDLSKIKTKRKGLKLAFTLLNAIKFPLPAVEFSQNKTHFHWMKF